MGAGRKLRPLALGGVARTGGERGRRGEREKAFAEISGDTLTFTSATTIEK
jgi:hypothetical protein